MHLVLHFLLRLFGSAVSRGGEPCQDTQDGSFGLTYPLRPGMFVYAVLTLLGGAYLLVHSGSLLVQKQPSIRNFEMALLAVFLLVASSLLLGRTVRLDEEGLSVRSIFGGSKLIRWSEFSHVERYRSTSAGKDTFFIRSIAKAGARDGETTICLPEMSYNTTDLLDMLRRRVALPEEPRRKKHWWGG